MILGFFSMGGSCLAVSPMEIILVLLAGIVLLFHSVHASISLLLCTLCSSVSLHSAAQFGNVLSGAGQSPVLSSKPGNHCWKEWERAVVTEVCRACHAVAVKRAVQYFFTLQRAHHFFLQPVQSHRCTTASLCYTLLSEAVHVIDLVLDTPFLCESL